MYNKKPFLTAIFLMFIFLVAKSQTTFPEKWKGHWTGNLYWYGAGKPAPQQVKMSLTILPDDTIKGAWSWQLVYGEAGADNRPYHLLPKDTARGHWIIDEHNGIVLDQYFLADRLTGAFTVQQSTIVNSYYLEGDALVVEFYSMGAKPLSETGKGTEDSPKVQSYKIGGYQRAVLHRKP